MKRRKAKVRRKRGYNATMVMWYRTERSRMKWVKAKHSRVVRAGKRIYPVNPLYGSTNEEQAGLGGLVNGMRKGKLQRREKRASLTIGTEEVSSGMVGARRPGMRLWQCGLVESRSQGNRRVGIGKVHGVQVRRGEVVRRDGKVSLGDPVRPGYGLEVESEVWERLKGARLGWHYGKGRYQRTGRVGLGYVEVDYVIGVVLVSKRPRSGEVLRAAGNRA